MSWEAVAAIAELAGAVGVILTLLYLARQISQNGHLIEQNSQLLTASVVIATREAGNELAKILGSDRDAARVYWAGLESRDALDKEEQQQFDALAFLGFSNFEQAFLTEPTERREAATLDNLRPAAGCPHPPVQRRPGH